MLPVEQSWYQKLLLISLALGLAGGVAALVFMGIVEPANAFVFGNTGTDWWSGNWWWIPLTAIGGLTVAILRKRLAVPAKVPGSIALAKEGWVNPSSVVNWVLISAVSLLTGASLGPSFALIVLGGGLGSWVSTRLRADEQVEEAKQEYTLVGMAGGLGAAFSAPLFATVMASELSPTSKRNYVAAFIPELIAATLGFVIYFGVTGSAMLGSYQLPAYEYSVSHLIMGVLLGLLSTFVLILYALISKAISAISQLIGNAYARGLIGGALVGLIAFALPLTATSGSSQLAIELENAAAMSAGFIATILVAKMLAIALSQSSGFLGGVVFPMIFLGGTAGFLVNSIFPGIPVALCVGAMLAAVPGAFLSAPVSLVLIAIGTVGIGPEALAPIAIAVASAHITMAYLQVYVANRRQVKLQAKSTD